MLEIINWNHPQQGLSKLVNNFLGEFLNNLLPFSFGNPVEGSC